MRKIIAVVCLFLLANFSNAQTSDANSADALLKEQIYNANKKIVINYSMKDFDTLFFEFSDKKSDPNILLTKEEFYNYTIKIAAFSDRLAKLYPKEKEVAEASKKKWFAEKYEDYLLSKASQKK